MRYLDDGTVPIDNNRVENQIRPWALGLSNWLLRRAIAQWPACGCHHEPDPVSQAEWT